MSSTASINVVFLSVLFRHPTLGAKVGGGEISNRKLLEAMAQSHQVFVVSALGNGLWGDRINGVTYYDLSVSPLLRSVPSRLAQVIAKFLFRYKSHNVIEMCKADVILCATLESSTALAYSKRNPVAVGTFIRAFENFEAYNPTTIVDAVKRVVRTVLYGNTQDKIINQLDFVFPNSDFMAEKCQQYFPNPSRYIVYPPIDLERRDSEQRQKVSAIRSIVMVSGAAKKGGDIFVALSKKFPEIEFSIIGYRGHLSADTCPKNLTLLPWVKAPETLITNADLVLVPSIWEEPFGRIAVEALQCGTPVLVSSIGGLPETVNYQNYLMVEAGNYLDWEKKLEECINNPETLISESLRAMAYAKKYGMNHQLNVLEGAMQQELQKVRAERAQLKPA